jgi:hypothetical protein
MRVTEIDRLIANLDKRAKLPRHFDLWPESMIILWLKSHQKKGEQNGKAIRSRKRTLPLRQVHR